MLARKRYIAGEVLSNYTVPVGRVFLVEEAFEVLGNLLLGFLAVNGFVDLRLDVFLHFGRHFANRPV